MDSPINSWNSFKYSLFVSIQFQCPPNLPTDRSKLPCFRAQVRPFHFTFAVNYFERQCGHLRVDGPQVITCAKRPKPFQALTASVLHQRIQKQLRTPFHSGLVAFFWSPLENATIFFNKFRLITSCLIRS